MTKSRIILYASASLILLGIGGLTVYCGCV